jgi:peroxiredoxin Q/BCP
MLKAGDLAPNLTALDDQGHTVTLRDLLQRGPLVLFFYPGDFTPMCTAQACGLRDSYAGLTEAGLQVAGINPGSQGSHAKFRERFKLPYPLLVDQGKAAAKAFGVGSYLGLSTRRASFLIATDQKVIEALRADLSLTAHDEFIARCVQWSINHTQQKQG